MVASRLGRRSRVSAAHFGFLFPISGAGMTHVWSRRCSAWLVALAACLLFICGSATVMAQDAPATQPATTQPTTQPAAAAVTPPGGTISPFEIKDVKDISAG